MHQNCWRMGLRPRTPLGKLTALFQTPRWELGLKVHTSKDLLLRGGEEMGGEVTGNDLNLCFRAPETLAPPLFRAEPFVRVSLGETPRSLKACVVGKCKGGQI